MKEPLIIVCLKTLVVQGRTYHTKGKTYNVISHRTLPKDALIIEVEVEPYAEVGSIVINAEDPSYLVYYNEED
ncbi:hypothetical protein MARVELLAND_210 [Bacillus phage vB_BspM_MarvelLand]|nr:hypothetical protein MARVELLAND_210 [Bacillus phage vB_BspM_MarvelLand]